ncbi:MAG TPA: hypothetical protein DCY02_04055 [Armatimonadetes bacterium]|nr:hypothetical protein [Armatimonadota bacterium]HCM73467.1 hypothetical protein [Armatimonadota bacterium]
MNKFMLVACAVTVVASANAANLLWNGDTTGQPTFNRPSSMTGLSGVGTAVPFQVQPFYVTASGTYTMEVLSTGWDTYALAYGAGWNPAAALTDLKNGDDDFTGSFTVLTGSGGGLNASRINAGDSSNFNNGGLNLTANTQYYAVVTGFGNTNFGRYEAGIGGGPGNVVAGAVPEPFSMVAMGAGLLALARRRRNAK